MVLYVFNVIINSRLAWAEKTGKVIYLDSATTALSNGWRQFPKVAYFLQVTNVEELPKLA